MKDTTLYYNQLMALIDKSQIHTQTQTQMLLENWILAGVSGLFLVIIGYFMVRFINKVDSSISVLNDSINGLTTTLLEQQGSITLSSQLNKQTEDHIVRVEKQVSDLTARVEDVEGDVNSIKETHIRKGCDRM
jgi:hypothetical protein